MMTDQRLTCAQVNEEVAEMLGWEHTSNTTPLGNELWLPPTNSQDNYQGLRLLPDYCGEWQHAGPLWGKLWENEKDDRDLLVYEVEIIQCELKCDLTEAITRAFHAAFVEEGEGI